MMPFPLTSEGELLTFNAFLFLTSEGEHLTCDAFFPDI